MQLNKGASQFYANRVYRKRFYIFCFFCYVLTVFARLLEYCPHRLNTMKSNEYLLSFCSLSHSNNFNCIAFIEHIRWLILCMSRGFFMRLLSPRLCRFNFETAFIFLAPIVVTLYCYMNNMLAVFDLDSSTDFFF